MSNYILLVREPSGEALLLSSDTSAYSKDCLAAYAGGNIGTIEGCAFCQDELMALLEEATDIFPVEQIYMPTIKKEASHA